MGTILIQGMAEKLLTRREVKTQDFDESIGLSEIQKSMFEDIDRAKRITHATKFSDESVADVYTPDQPDFAKGKQMAKNGVTALKAMIWADKFIRKDQDVSSLNKIVEVPGGWRIQWDEKSFMEVVFE